MWIKEIVEILDLNKIISFTQTVFVYWSNQQPMISQPGKLDFSVPTLESLF